MALPLGLLRRVDSYFGEYLSQKSKTRESYPDISFSRSNSSCSIATDEGLFEQPEPLGASKSVMEKIHQRRSLQLRDQQRAWQVLLNLRSYINASFQCYVDKTFFKVLFQNSEAWMAIPCMTGYFAQNIA